MRKLLGIILTWAWVWTMSGSEKLEGKVVELDSGVRQFIQTYCIQCHGPEEQKGERSFHQLTSRAGGKWMMDLAKPGKADLLHDILDQLNLRDAPQKEGRQAT